MKKKRNLLGNLLLASLLFSPPLLLLTVHLGAAEKAQQGVQLRIGAILVSNERDYFDPKLSRLKAQLEGIKYRSYRLLKDESQNVPWKANGVFQLPGGRALVVVPQEYHDERISLEVRLLEGDKPFLDTKIRLRNRGNILVGGPPHEKGVLFISISATTQ